MLRASRRTFAFSPTTATDAVAINESVGDCFDGLSLAEYKAQFHDCFWDHGTTKKLMHMASPDTSDWSKVAEQLGPQFSANAAKKRFESVHNGLCKRFNSGLAKRRLKFSPVDVPVQKTKTKKSVALTERQQIALLTRQTGLSDMSLGENRDCDGEVDDVPVIVHPKETPEAGGSGKRTSSKKTKQSKSKARLQRVRVWIPNDFDTWERNRQRAWRNLACDPDAYYFKFAKPGLPVSKSDWSKQELDQFAKALKERPPQGKWGLFSLQFPFRTGRQCMECFRRLKQKSTVRSVSAGGAKKVLAAPTLFHTEAASRHSSAEAPSPGETKKLQSSPIRPTNSETTPRITSAEEPTQAAAKIVQRAPIPPNTETVPGRSSSEEPSPAPAKEVELAHTLPNTETVPGRSSSEDLSPAAAKKIEPARIPPITETASRCSSAEDPSPGATKKLQSSPLPPKTETTPRISSAAEPSPRAATKVQPAHIPPNTETVPGRSSAEKPTPRSVKKMLSAPIPPNEETDLQRATAEGSGEAPTPGAVKLIPQAPIPLNSETIPKSSAAEEPTLLGRLSQADSASFARKAEALSKPLSNNLSSSQTPAANSARATITHGKHMVSETIAAVLSTRKVVRLKPTSLASSDMKIPKKHKYLCKKRRRKESGRDGRRRTCTIPSSNDNAVRTSAFKKLKSGEAPASVAALAASISAGTNSEMAVEPPRSPSIPCASSPAAMIPPRQVGLTPLSEPAAMPASDSTPAVDDTAEPRFDEPLANSEPLSQTVSQAERSLCKKPNLRHQQQQGRVPTDPDLTLPLRQRHRCSSKPPGACLSLAELMECERHDLRQKFSNESMRLLQFYRECLARVTSLSDSSRKKAEIARLHDEFELEQSKMQTMQEIQSECLLMMHRNRVLTSASHSSLRLDAVAVSPLQPLLVQAEPSK